MREELMLFDPESSRFFMLNPAMALVWRHCDGCTTVADVAERVVGQFAGVGRAGAADDVSRSVEELRELGLLEIAADTAAQVRGTW